MLKLHEAWGKVAEKIASGPPWVCHAIGDLVRSRHIDAQTFEEMIRRVRLERLRQERKDPGVFNEAEDPALWPHLPAHSGEGRCARLKFILSEVNRLHRLAKRGVYRG